MADRGKWGIINIINAEYMLGGFLFTQISGPNSNNNFDFTSFLEKKKQ